MKRPVVRLAPFLLLAVIPSIRAVAQDTSAAGRAQERAALLAFCEQTDSTAPHTLEGTRLRTDCWKRMQLQGMGDSVVDARYRAAVADYDSAVRADSSQRAGDSSVAAIGARMAQIQQAIQERRLDDAQRLTEAVLSRQPQNQRALAYRDRIAALERARRLRIILVTIAVAVLTVAAALSLLARGMAARHERNEAQRRQELAQRKAMVEIVDGVGRGKMYQVNGPVFRIGSAESDRPDEHNDVVLSDAAAYISRFHCSIIRKEGNFYLIDSSLNGTYMGDELLERGEHRLLEDGSEFSLAGMARFKFLLMG